MLGVRSERIHVLARRIGLSKAELLKLAREIAEDAKLLSIDHMTIAESERLETELILLECEIPIAA
jgi:hypothetical protein